MHRAMPSITRLSIPLMLLSLTQQAAALSPIAELGNKLFHDPALSASGQQSCASCHSAQNAGMANNKLAVQLGGVSLNAQDFRNVPTLMYSRFVPQPSTSANGQPIGGLQLDGRAANLAAQAVMPFLAPNEMANATSADVRQRLQQRPYLGEFQRLFGSAILNDADATLQAIGKAIAAYEVEDPALQPFSSKFDAVQRSQAQFSAREANGWRLFNDPDKGNCLRCHSSSGTQTRPALFTNFSYHALALPRNWQIIYNRDDLPLPDFAPSNGLTLGAPGHRYYDLGACGPLRTDLASQTGQCGKFRVPTLRNVALKGAYGHNGVFADLFQVLDFYTTRDLQPARWYRKADGVSPDLPYNDLPLQYQTQIARMPPFHFLPGRIARLTTAEQRDIVAFLCTLTDGYEPGNPAAYRYPPQCQAASQ